MIWSQWLIKWYWNEINLIGKGIHLGRIRATNDAMPLSIHSRVPFLFVPWFSNNFGVSKKILETFSEPSKMTQVSMLYHTSWAVIVLLDEYKLSFIDTVS